MDFAKMGVPRVCWCRGRHGEGLRAVCMIKKRRQRFEVLATVRVATAGFLARSQGTGVYSTREIN